MKQISLLFLSLSIFLFTAPAAFAQSANLSGLVLTSAIVKKATLTDGMKGSFCQIDPGISAQQLLTVNLHDNFKLPDTIPTAACIGQPEDVIFSTLYIDFKQPIQGVGGNGFNYVLFRNQLLQENNKSRGGAYYGTPPNSTFYIFNGGEEGNTPIAGGSPNGDPIGLQYERAGNLIQIDDSLPNGYQPVPESGYLLHFDENGKRKDLLFFYQGKIFKLIHAERKSANIVLVDYSNIPSPTSGSGESYLNTYVDPLYYFTIQYPPGLIDSNTSPNYGIILNPTIFTTVDNQHPLMFTLTARKVDTAITDPKELFGQYGQTRYGQDILQQSAIQSITVGNDKGYLISNVPIGESVALERDEIILHDNILIDMQTHDDGNSKSLINQIISSFRF